MEGEPTGSIAHDRIHHTTAQHSMIDGSTGICYLCCWSCCKCHSQLIEVPQTNNITRKHLQQPSRDSSYSLPALEEIRSWGKSFEKLMSSIVGQRLFKEFLHYEYSEENILFYLACEELKLQTEPKAIEENARAIYEEYISIFSQREVSLDSGVRELVNARMAAPGRHSFDEAQLQIYTLMHRDSYPRFISSQMYKQMLCDVSILSDSNLSSCKPSPVSC